MFLLEPKVEKAIEGYLNEESVDGMYFMSSRVDNKPVTMKVVCECLSGIITSEYGHSVLCKLVDSEDVDKFEDMEKEARDLLPEKTQFKEFLKEEKFFLKLAIKDDKYKPRILPTANPGQPEKSGFVSGSVIELEMNPSMWVRFSGDECHAGLFINVNKIVIDGGKKKKTKR